ncbi:hypothetical protein LCGC14_1436420 [marine sediment metagenome]|uniref:Uncharacterized protein n=1 Tax=marine sediment metagenome TaxID=412755 RepID=A0A0F9K887_9ZZZZ
MGNNVPPDKTPTFYKIVWSVALRSFVDYNRSYDQLMEEKRFLEKLRYAPERLSQDEIKDHLLNFLNTWGCRITKSQFDHVSIKLKKFFIEYKGKFYLTEDITTFDFYSNEISLKTMFNKLYYIDEIGPTSISKISHILNPNLFVMWDMEIAKKLNHKHSTIGYFEFLIKMQEHAKIVLKSFNEMHPHEKDLERYLNNHFRLKQKCTLAKFLDEYNWAVYTKNWKIPPEWDVSILLPREKLF